MKPTVQLEILDEHAGAVVSGHVCEAVAVKVGLGPLAADRLGTAIERAVRAAGCPIYLAASVEGSDAVIAITADRRGWQPAAIAALADTQACRTDSSVEIRIKRPPLTMAEG